ncbi:hypothetical protein [Streptomyces broussonetiae]|uniref:Uncharacterized protein n=1 Tax=Streptomyces broussonetiae TaxID=2686304 RepID=A0A6I6N8Y3_9ACTN|nr:hypothetical protein [Streptomyces broussonetiae]QHA04827.1 hypothetical protein GQF42_17365 [Streptomyces broussonetiae]
MSAARHKAHPHMAALAEELSRAGAIRTQEIRTQEWADIFAIVPRHAFVPHRFEQETNDRGITVWRQRGAATKTASRTSTGA